MKLLIEKSEKGIETVKTDITHEMNKKFPDYTDSERYQLSDIRYQFARNKKRFRQNLEIRRNKNRENFLKKEQTQKQVEVINLKAPFSNLQTTAVKIMSNTEQPHWREKNRSRKARLFEL